MIASKWLAFGTGVGVEINGEDLFVTVARVRPSGVEIAGSLNIQAFRDQAASVWGSVYRKFLKKLGGSHLAAVVLLPRSGVIVRQLNLPGVSNRDMAAAIALQVDTQHPFPEEDAVHAWARIGKTDTVLVGITRRQVIEEYTTLFAEAGIKISSFTFSAAALYSGVRMFGDPPGVGFLAVSGASKAQRPLAAAPTDKGTQQNWGDDEFEAYGESPARPVFSARFDSGAQRALTQALAELRLPAESEPVPLDSVLPRPTAMPVDFQISTAPLPYAAALSAACPWLALNVNLLPETSRQSSSRMIFIPTIVLGCLVALAGVGLAAHGGYDQRRYLESLHAEIRKIEPMAARSHTLDVKIAETRRRIEALDSFRLRTRDDMDTLDELTRILAPPTWVDLLEMTRGEVRIAGGTEQAAALLKTLDGTHKFQNSEFTMPMGRQANIEVFSIRAQRTGVRR